MEKLEVLDFDDKPKKKGKIKKIIITLIIIILLFILLLVFGFKYFSSPVASKSEIISFTVENGDTVYGVGEKLEEDKIIRSAFIYKVLVKLKNVNEFKAGIYRLDKSYSMSDIIDILSGNSYKNDDISITFKEGKTIRNVVRTISKNTNITESEIFKQSENKDYIESLIKKYWFLTDDIKNENIYYPLEGYLYPETYSFSSNTNVQTIIETMLNQTNKVLSKYEASINSSSYSVHEIVTLASIVESEGIYEDDRKSIAGVFYNRLNKGMSLGSDVTTYYAAKVDLGERDLTTSEINSSNPYNTRNSQMNGKLPVGPISNFSESSLNAVLNPTKNNYYYFVADKSGKTHFTKTYDEHKKIIAELKAAGNWIEW